jgi:hypothetical protein
MLRNSAFLSRASHHSVGDDDDPDPYRNLPSTDPGSTSTNGELNTAWRHAMIPHALSSVPD